MVAAMPTLVHKRFELLVVTPSLCPTIAELAGRWRQRRRRTSSHYRIWISWHTWTSVIAPGLLVRFVEVRVWGTINSRFHWPILGTLAPLVGLSQLQTLIISGDYRNPMKFEGQILGLYGRNFSLMWLVKTGDLQPLQNLNLLTKLDLSECCNLIG